jgi:hypothetical protein
MKQIASSRNIFFSSSGSCLFFIWNRRFYRPNQRYATAEIITVGGGDDKNNSTDRSKNQHGGRKDNTIILTNGQLARSTTTGEAHV